MKRRLPLRTFAEAITNDLRRHIEEDADQILEQLEDCETPRQHKRTTARLIQEAETSLRRFAAISVAIHEHHRDAHGQSCHHRIDAQENRIAKLVDDLHGWIVMAKDALWRRG